MKNCDVEGCSEQLTKKGHRLCYRHWKMNRDGQLHETSLGMLTENAPADGGSDADCESGGRMLTSTNVAKHFGLSAHRVNQILAELGWIEKYIKGWTPTEHGNRLGAQVREARQSGVPYVVWPRPVLDNAVLKESIRDVTGGDAAEVMPDILDPPPLPAKEADNFRSRFPATYRATDGHMVRSRAEMLIDNWLYMQSIVHAFERKLPIEEDVYCDFYLPEGKVYIEYWGLEDDPKYASRKAEKQAIYSKYNLNLVELGDEQIMNLDDCLPRMLLRFQIKCT